MARTLHIDYGESPVANLYDARDQSSLASADGDVIVNANDPATNLGMSTSFALGIDKGPLWRTPANGINGLSVGRFNGTDSYAVSVQNAGSGPVAFKTVGDFISASAFTIAIVFQAEADSVSGNPGTTNSGVRFMEDPALSLSMRYFTNAGVQELYLQNTDSGGADRVGPLVFEKDVPQLLIFRHDGGTLYASVNDGAESSVSSGNTADLTQNIWFGVSFVYGGFFTGPWCELAIYNTGDADGGLAALKTALMAKWGIEVGGGSTFPALTVAL